MNCSSRVYENKKAPTIHQHSKEACDKWYLRKLEENQQFCLDHEDSALLIGGVCTVCHPNHTVIGLQQDDLYKMKTASPTSVFQILKIRNGEVVSDPLNQAKNIIDQDNDRRYFENPVTFPVPRDLMSRILGIPGKVIPVPEHPPDTPPHRDQTPERDQPFLQYEVEWFPFKAFKLMDPEKLEQPHLYLYDNIYRIIRGVNSSQLMLDSQNKCYKAWIWADSHFVRRGSNEDGPFCERDKMFHNTFAVKLLGFNGKLTKKSLYFLIRDLCNKFTRVHEQLSRSGWSFEFSDNIRIVLAEYSGRPVEDTGKVKPKPINGFIKYPVGRRGTQSCINVRYPLFLTSKKYQKLEVYNGDPYTAPCVRFALKSHFINHGNRPDKVDIINNLLSFQSFDDYSVEAKFALSKQPVNIPDQLFSHGLTLKDFGKLEYLNKVPIAVYHLTKCKIDPKGVYINTLRAPKINILKKYDTPVCHLLMISDDHVVYIPSMENFMQSVFDHRLGRGKNQPLNHRTQRRCPYCFSIVLNKQMLISHLEKGTCYNEISQPATIHLPAPGSKIKHFNLTDRETAGLTVILDIEASLKKGRVNRIPSTGIGDDSSSSSQDNSESEQENFERIFSGLGKDVIDDKVKFHHVPQSVGMLFLDEHYNDIGYDEILDDDCQYKFAKRITENIQKHMEAINASKCDKATLTREQHQAFREATHCGFCDGEFARMHTRSKHRHHNWSVHPVIENGVVIKGNYEHALCHLCNLRVTSKRKQAVCIFHNGSGYDLPMLMKGMTSDKENISKIRILPKGPFSFYNVKYKNASFIDSCSFIDGSLNDLVELICENVNDPMDLRSEIPITVDRISKTYGEELIPYLRTKQLYPYRLATCVKDLESIKEWPDKIHFYNDIKETEISDEDYSNGKEVWDILKSKFGDEMSLKVLHSYYLLSDITFLADVWVYYCKRIKADFDIHPSNCITGPGLAYKAALYMGKRDLEQLSCHAQFLDFESSLRGGFVTVTKRHVICNNIELGDKYDPSKKDVFMVFIDWNSLYSYLLKLNLPYELFAYEENPHLFDKDYILNLDTSIDAKKGYFLTVSIKIPEKLKYLYDDFPLGLINTDKIKPSEHSRKISKKGGQKKLIAGHFDLCEYTFDAELLQFS